MKGRKLHQLPPRWIQCKRRRGQIFSAFGLIAGLGLWPLSDESDRFYSSILSSLCTHHHLLNINKLRILKGQIGRTKSHRLINSAIHLIKTHGERKIDLTAISI